MDQENPKCCEGECFQSYRHAIDDKSEAGKEEPGYITAGP
jgi:hypothetical protein